MTNAYPFRAFMRSRMPALRVIEGGCEPKLEDDIVAVIDEHLSPALLGLRTAAAEHDDDAVRAYAYELIFLSGCVLSTSARHADRHH